MLGQAKILQACDSADVNHSENGQEEIPIEYLRSLSPSGLPLAELRLKVGAPVMLLRNLFPSQGLCNGTRLMITRIGRHCLEAKILNAQDNGPLCLIPRITLSTQEGELPFILSRKQFPVRLCFAMTVNKAQGQSLDTVGIDLRTWAFTHGQLYVALSQITDVRQLLVLQRPDQVERITHNVVYPEVLLH